MTNQAQPSFIDSQNAFEEFLQLHQDIDWIGFDTEFIGEHRLIPLLCLIQISSKHGIFLIDTIAIEDISGLLEWMEDPNILKLTHAGNNDYALLYALYNTHPKNVFDVQIAAGFLGYPYPVGFQKMIKEELGQTIGKAAGVTDWSRRPLSQKQIIYAADDVRYLYELWTRFKQKLEASKMITWSEEEFGIMLAASTASSDWQEEFLKFRKMAKLYPKEKKLVLRIIKWRAEEAAKKNVSKDAVFPMKMLMEVVKSIKESEKEIRKHRLLNRSKIRRHWTLFQAFFLDNETTQEEADLLKKVNSIKKKTPAENLRYTFLKLMIKQRCYDFGIPEGLVVNGLGLSNPLLENFPKTLTAGWRGVMLGPTLVDWLENKSPLTFDFEKEHCIVKRK